MDENTFSPAYSESLANQTAFEIAEQNIKKQYEIDRERDFNHRINWAVLIVSCLNLLVSIAAIVISLCR